MYSWIGCIFVLTGALCSGARLPILSRLEQAIREGVTADDLYRCDRTVGSEEDASSFIATGDTCGEDMSSGDGEGDGVGEEEDEF